MQIKDCVMKSEVHILNNIVYKDTFYGDITKIFYVLEDIQFGVNSNNNWIQLSDGNKEINNLEDKMIIDEVNDSILSLLEININNLKESIKKSLKNNKITDVLAETFPYETVIMNGLYSESDWWVGLSLGWLNDMKIKNNYNYNKIMAMVEKIRDNKEYDQNIRHKAKKVFFKYTI